MTIQTKYNIGDDVWFRHLAGDVEQAMITEVRVVASNNGRQAIQYRLSTARWDDIRAEHWVYETKEQAEKSDW